MDTKKMRMKEGKDKEEEEGRKGKERRGRNLLD